MALPICGGSMSAFLTPFDEKGRIIESAVKELADFHIESGLHGLYVGGSTGEGMIMTTEDRMKLAEIAVKAANKRVPVIIHVGTTDTATAIKLAQHAQSIGADGLSSVPPFYYKMSPEYIAAYYKAIADSVDIPLLLYNIPMLTGTSISADFMIELAKVKNIIGLKFTDTNLEEFRKIKDYDNGSIQAYIGFDQMLLCALIMGGDGGIGSWYNVMPKAFANIYNLYRAGRLEEARELTWKVDRYIAIIKKYPRPANQPVCKAILRRMGIDLGTVLGPLQPMKPLDEQSLIDELTKAGFFEFVRS